MMKTVTGECRIYRLLYGGVSFPEGESEHLSFRGVCRILQALDTAESGLPWMREIRRAVRSGGKTVLRKRGSGFQRGSPCIL